MKTSNLFKKLLWAITAVVTLTWIACGSPGISSIDQPGCAEFNGSFNVDVTVYRSIPTVAADSILNSISMTLPSEWNRQLQNITDYDYKLIFSVQLPVGWTVADSIPFTGDADGVFLYSDSLSRVMKIESPPDSLYYWWVSETAEFMDSGLQGTIFYTPVITTSQQKGTFFLDYSIGYSGNLSSSISADHLITVGLPDTVYVTNLASSGLGSLRAAIDSVSFGGTILFNLFYPATISLSEEILIYKSVNITGPENASLTISGNDYCRAFNVDTNRFLNLSHLKISKGFTSGDGGGVLFNYRSEGVLTDVKFTDNHANNGGAIFGLNIENLLIEDAEINDNHAITDGGGLMIKHDNMAAALTLNNVIVRNNSSQQYGGGIYCSGNVPEISFTGLEVINNTSGFGGGLFLGWGIVNIAGSSIRNNEALFYGGGLYFSGYPGDIYFDPVNRSCIYNNSSQLKGRDLCVSNGYFGLDNSVVTLDTFSVIQPNDYYAYPTGDPGNFDILHYVIPQIDHDIYVSPSGSDSNSGISPGSPFKTITHALELVISDPADPNTIFLAEGTYSESSNGEQFPLYTCSDINISGQGKENTLLASNLSDAFNIHHDHGVQITEIGISKRIDCLSSIIKLEDFNANDIDCFSSTMELENFTLSDIYSSNSDILLTDGRVDYYGISAYSSDISCNDIVFSNISNGSALEIRDSSTVSLVNCMIENNIPEFYPSNNNSVYVQNSHLNLSGTTIRNNGPAETGGGICFDQSTAWFDPVNRCNIYLNSAGYGTDLFSMNQNLPIQVVLDTFTVLLPTDYHAYPIYDFYFDILNGKIQQVTSDLYFSPLGSDNNSGLTLDEPLLTITKGISKYIPDYDHQHTFHLASGIYSQNATGEYFPLFLPGYITLSGAGKDSTKLFDVENQDRVILSLGKYRDTVRDLTIEDYAPYNRNGIEIQGGSIHLDDISISDQSNGIYISGYCQFSTDSVEIINNLIGIRTYDATVKLEDIEIAGNRHFGIYIEGGDVECKNLLVHGGGPPSDPYYNNFYCENALLTVIHCEFSGDEYSYSQGGNLVGCQGLFLGNVWKNNSTPGNSGAGVNLSSCQNITFVNDRFENNKTDYNGGGISVNSSFPVFSGCVFRNNKSAAGGGLYFYQNDGFAMVGCLVENNSAITGGGICDDRENGYLSNTTIRNNLADFGGGIYFGNKEGQNEWDDISRCNVYFNNARVTGHDLYSLKENLVHPIVVDTFTVIDPNDQIAWHKNNFNFDILFGKGELGDYDIYVSPGGDDANSGLSPEEPLKTIMKANLGFSLDTLLPHTIHLAEGIYSPSQTGEFLPVEVFNGIEILGTGKELTIINGDFIAPIFTANNYSNYFNLKHLTLRRGNADQLDGGAITCINTMLDLEDVTIDSCKANSGGAINSSNSALKLNDVSIDFCSANNGGAVYAYMSQVNIMDVIVTGNRANKGGALYTENSNLYMQNAEFLDNSASNEGGGWFGTGLTYCNAQNVFFRNNYTDGYYHFGGGIYMDQATGILRNLVLENNNSKLGGGIYFESSDVDLVNMAFINNKAVIQGGAIYFHHSVSDMEFASFEGNEAITGNTLAMNTNSAIGVSNSVLEGDHEKKIYLNNSELSISYCDLTGGDSTIYLVGNSTVNWLEGNIDADPMFIGTGEHPLALSPGSPCIDAGEPPLPGQKQLPFDLMGNSRKSDGDGDGLYIEDMGAYEFIGLKAPVPEFLVQSSEFKVQSYPNPTSGIVDFRFSMVDSRRVSLKIYDVHGREVATVMDDKMAAGEHTVRWNAEGLPAGIYIYRISTIDNRQSATGKLVKY